MNQEPKVNIVNRGETAVVEIVGDITSQAEKAIVDAYERLTAEGKKNVVLKFSHETFINSAGIAIIIGLVGRSREKGQKIAVCGISKHFAKIFEMVGLTDYVGVFPDEQSALAGL